MTIEDMEIDMDMEWDTDGLPKQALPRSAAPPRSPAPPLVGNAPPGPHFHNLPSSGFWHWITSQQRHRASSSPFFDAGKCFAPARRCILRPNALPVVASAATAGVLFIAGVLAGAPKR